jgi:hypothetical protein
MDPMALNATGRAGREGQAMVESCLVIVLICLMFLGLFQVIQAYAFREVLDHAAARTARARAVGFNDWMLDKCMRVAVIPNAGRLIQPVIPGVDPVLQQAIQTLEPGELWDFALTSSPASPQVAIENALIPDYLASPHLNQARQIMDYERWQDISMYYAGGQGGLPGTPENIGIRVRQDIPLLVARADMEAGQLTGADPGTVGLVGRFNIEQHYSLYLDNMGW